MAVALSHRTRSGVHLRSGLFLMVSEEFTVPLSAMHHNAVYLSGSEKAWWRAQGIEPREIAAKLWVET